MAISGFINSSSKLNNPKYNNIASSSNVSVVTNGLLSYVDASKKQSYSGSGNVWADLSDMRNNVALIDGPGFSSSNGGLITFDGVTNRGYIETRSFNINTFSINMWIRPTTIGTFRRIVSKVDPTGNSNGFSIVESGATTGKLVFIYQPNFVTGEVLRRSTTVMSTNIFYNVGMTYSSATGIKIYFNGVEDTGETSGSPDTGFSANPGFSTMGIGARAGGGGNHWNGDMGTLLIYNRVITAAEMQENFNVDKKRFGY